MKNDDPAAPWEEFPYPPISMGWRMGDGEDFFHEWVMFWDGLTDLEAGRILVTSPGFAGVGRLGSRPPSPYG